jgi:fluoride exporter
VGYLIVFVGGGIGAALRHAANQASLWLLGPSFPAGTLFVNILGSTIMGLLAGWFAFRGGHETMRLFLATGILGGFTTFSAFSLDTVAMWQRGDYLMAAAYVAASVAVSVAGLSLGLLAARSFS